MSIISDFSRPGTSTDYLVEFLEQLDNLPASRTRRTAITQRMAIRPGHKVLDLGCGIGGVTFQLADLTGPTGLAAGVDINPALLDVATRRARNRSGLEFRSGDAAAIPYPAGFFDAAYSERMFLYLPDRLAALHELRRVVKPGGQVWLIDTDFDATAIYSSHPELTRKMLAILAAAIPNRNSARELPALAKKAGLLDVRFETFAVNTSHPFQVHAMSGVLAEAVARGVITKSDLDTWQSEQAALNASGDFLHAWLFVLAVGTV